MREEALRQNLNRKSQAASNKQAAARRARALRANTHQVAEQLVLGLVDGVEAVQDVQVHPLAHHGGHFEREVHAGLQAVHALYDDLQGRGTGRAGSWLVGRSVS